MSMRKVWWSCTALAVAAAAGTYLAADYARCHHDSFLGRVVVGAYHAALHANPLFAVSQALRGSHPAPAAPGEVARAVGASGAAEEAAEPPEETVIHRHRLPGRIVINEEEPINEGPIQTGSIDCGQEPPMLSGAAIELIAPPTELPDDATVMGEPAFMPRAADDDAPATMPYAEADEEFSSFWMHVFGQALGGDCCKEEASEPPSGAEPPECREDPHYHLHYQGCPYYICPQQRNYCPYSGQPVIPPAEPRPQPEAEGGKPARPRALEGWEESETCPKHPTVDTMEFRPSDAKPEEFGLVPF